MSRTWHSFFDNVPDLTWTDHGLEGPVTITTLEHIKRLLDLIHIKYCLLRPFCSHRNYPLVSPTELLPSFEPTLYEYSNLPGFSMVAFDRPLDYFHEVFQFDILHCVEDTVSQSLGPATPLEDAIRQQNFSTLANRLPRHLQDQFTSQFSQLMLTNLQFYPTLLPFLLDMDRGHVLAKNSQGKFYFAGIYASFPSDLDSELKRFGLQIGKFRPRDNRLYELNRNFVYQFLMELYGFPIASERRTSAALFARRLFKMGESFLIRVMGQSDRTLTSLYSSPQNKRYPQVEKIALVSVAKLKKEQIQVLKDKGLLISQRPPALILKVSYRQHKYDPNNIRTDRALSVVGQEVIHPHTGKSFSNFNIVKDTALLTLILNDIVKGEFVGRVRYKRNEIVENTESHENRLKFLYAWLSKNQRRIIGYSDEFFYNVSKVLDNYLLNPDHYDLFKKMSELYQDVWERYSYIQQARKLKNLEDLAQRSYKGQKINYLEQLNLATRLVQDLKFEIVQYFDTIVSHAIHTCETILNNPYLRKKYIEQDDEQLTEYGKKIKKLFGQLVALVDDLKAIRKTRAETPERRV